MKAFNDEELSLLKEALVNQDPSGAPEGCPNKEELWESAAGGLDPLENEPIILHLTECSECSMIWRLAREMVLPERTSSSPVIPLNHRRRWRTWRRAFVPAIAATVIVGVGLSFAWLARKGASPEPVFRQQPDATSIFASPDTLQRPRTSCRLEWTAGPDGTRFDLIATDARLEILGTVKGLTQPEYVLPAEAIPPSTTEVLWRVTAHLPDGRTVASGTFTTRIDDLMPAQE